VAGPPAEEGAGVGEIAAIERGYISLPHQDRKDPP